MFDDGAAQPKNNLVKLAYVDVVRFFSTVLGEGGCASCGSNKFVINTDPDDRTMARVYTIPVFGDKRRSMPVIINHCDVCGVVYSHVYTVIRKWIEDNPVVLDEVSGEATEGTEQLGGCDD